jgi:hypothetical protein
MRVRMSVFDSVREEVKDDLKQETGDYIPSDVRHIRMIELRKKMKQRNT